ncbi:3-amino-5-hydroxybenzoic acid synthase [Sesbania bispinosa]|nr:3-amino-5-hydroxybenzoic acid synthase [Sesbania bispinosa]
MDQKQNLREKGEGRGRGGCKQPWPPWPREGERDQQKRSGHVRPQPWWRARPTEAQVREGGCERFSRGSEAVVIDPTTQRLNGEGGFAGCGREIEVEDGDGEARSGGSVAVCLGWGGRGTELWRSRNKSHTLSWNISCHSNVREKSDL